MKNNLIALLVVFASVGTVSIQADVKHKQINATNSITYVEDDPWQPEGFENGLLIPAPYIQDAEIVLDGVDSEQSWNVAKEVKVQLSHGTVKSAAIKAIYTNKKVFIRLKWKDSTEDRAHHPWVWDDNVQQFVSGPQIEDSVILSFEAGCEWTPSFLSGYVYDFDGWQWLAARSDPLGQAVDLYGNVQDRDLTKMGFTRYASRNTTAIWNLKFIDHADDMMSEDWDKLDRVYLLQPANQTVYYRGVPDGFRPPQFAQLLEAPGIPPDPNTKIYPRYKPVKLVGEAGEVSAKGNWADGFWTVEFSRDLVTPAGAINDAVFNRLTQFSIHVFDHVEKIDKSSESRRLFLQFLAEE